MTTKYQWFGLDEQAESIARVRTANDAAAFLGVEGLPHEALVNGAIVELIAASGQGGGGAGLPGIDVLPGSGVVGDGVTDDAPALSALAASLIAGGTIYFTPGKTYRLATSFSVPSTVTLWLPRGAQLKIDGVAVVVRIRGGIDAGRYQIFQYANGGSISFIGPTDVGIVTSLNRPNVYPEWWGGLPYQYGSPVDVTTAFANMMAAIAPFYGAGKTAANASGWTTANVSLDAGNYRVSATPGQAAIAPPYSSRGFTMTGAGIQRTFIECADGVGVTKTTPAMAMLDLNGQFFARIENFSMGGVAGQGNYSYGVYYHRNANTSALGSSQLTVKCVEITDPWIVAAWRFGSDLAYDPNNVNQVDNVVTDRLMAHRNTFFANDGYCQFGVKQGVGVTTNTLNFTHKGIDIIGCGVGFYNSATNGSVEDWELAANDVDFSVNQNAVAYFRVARGRSEGSRKAIDAMASNWSYASNVTFEDCLWQLSNLANDPVDGTPDWAKVAATGSWTFRRIEVSAIANPALQPSLRVYNASADRLTITLDNVRVQYATRAGWAAFDAGQGETDVHFDIQRLDFLDANASVIDSIGMDGPTRLAKPGTIYNRRLGTWWGEANDVLGVDSGVGRIDYGVAGSPNFLAHTLSIVPIGTKLQSPHVTTTDAAGGTNYLVALVGYDGAGHQSSKGPNAASIQCLAEPSLSASHFLTVIIEDAAASPLKGRALALTYDVIYSTDGGTTWKLAPGGGRVPYATLTMNPLKITAAGTAYTLPASDSTGKLCLGNAAAATTPGAVANKFPVYDASGTLLGYVPVYSTIT